MANAECWAPSSWWRGGSWAQLVGDGQSCGRWGELEGAVSAGVNWRELWALGGMGCVGKLPFDIKLVHEDGSKCKF